MSSDRDNVGDVSPKYPRDKSPVPDDTVVHRYHSYPVHGNGDSRRTVHCMWDLDVHHAKTGKNWYFPKFMKVDTKWGELDTILEKLRVETDMAQKILGLTSSEMQKTARLRGAEWKLLSNCLFARMAEKVEMSLETESQDHDMADLYTKMRHMASEDELADIASVMQTMHVSSDTASNQIQTLYRGISLRDMLSTAYLFDFATNDSIDSSLRAATMIEAIHWTRNDNLKDLFFKPTIAEKLENWVSPMVSCSLTPDLTQSAGMERESFIPLMNLMVRRFILTDRIQHDDWAILLHVSNHDLDVTKQLSDQLNPIRQSYQRLDTGIQRIIYFFKAKLPTSARLDQEEFRFLGVLILRSELGVSLTMLDEHWANFDFSFHCEKIRAYYMNLLAGVAVAIGLDEFDIVVPSMYVISDSSLFRVSDFLDMDFFESGFITEDTTYFKSGDRKINIIQGRDADIFKRYHWLFDVVNNGIRNKPKHEWTTHEPHKHKWDVNEHDRLVSHSQHSFKYSKSLHSDQWVTQTHDPVIYALRCLSQVEYNIDAFVSEVVTEIKMATVVTNAHITACILAGHWLIPPCVVQSLLAMERNIETPFYLIDGGDNRPSDVYSWCLSHAGDKVQLHSLKHELLREEEDEGGTSVPEDQFRVEPVVYTHDKEKSLRFLVDLKRMAHERWTPLVHTRKTRPDTDFHDTPLHGFRRRE